MASSSSPDALSFFFIAAALLGAYVFISTQVVAATVREPLRALVWLIDEPLPRGKGAIVFGWFVVIVMTVLFHGGMAGMVFDATQGALKQTIAGIALACLSGWTTWMLVIVARARRGRSSGRSGAG